MKWFALFASVLGSLFGTRHAAAQDAAGEAAPTAQYASIYEIPVQPMQADEHSSPTLAPYRGKVLLIVNVASKCGFTPQYEGLERVHRKYKDQGLVVLGFPSNDFMGQEPGTEEEIRQFCSTKYDVSFPLYAKIRVKGGEQAPLYAWLTGPANPEPGGVKWNFEKFIVGRDGKIVARFRSPAKPESKEMTAAIEKALAEPAQ